jgi:hypothetical protein
MLISFAIVKTGYFEVPYRNVLNGISNYKNDDLWWWLKDGIVYVGHMGWSKRVKIMRKVTTVESFIAALQVAVAGSDQAAAIFVTWCTPKYWEGKKAFFTVFEKVGVSGYIPTEYSVYWGAGNKTFILHKPGTNGTIICRKYTISLLLEQYVD